MAFTPEQQKVIDELKKYGIKDRQLVNQFVTLYLDRTKKQLEAMPYREVRDGNKNSGWVIRAIQKNYSLPAEMIEAEELQKKRLEKEIQGEKLRLEAEAFQKEQQEKIDACSFCDEKGQRIIKARENPDYSAFHLCTHKPETETGLKDYYGKKKANNA